MSLLVKSSASLKLNWRLSDDEIVYQVRTIMFAGHETTGKTLTFALWELAKNRQFQERLRTEINETLKRVRARGGDDFTANDFETMPCLVALTKETLRVHPIAIEIVRAPSTDDVLPLSKPVIGASGKTYTELLIPAGTPIFISPLGYNMNRDVWGSDADVFRPERWFEVNQKPETAFGVYGNLATFSGGHRSCIGWRFAVIEIQAFLVTLVRRFDFSLPEDPPRIKRFRGTLISPLVAGEEAKGSQLPLKVAVLNNG